MPGLLALVGPDSSAVRAVKDAVGSATVNAVASSIHVASADAGYRFPKHIPSPESIRLVVLALEPQQAIAVSRAVAAMLEECQYIFVVAPEKETSMRRSLLYSAPSGNRWSVETSLSTLPGVICDAMRAASQRTRFRTTIARIAKQLPMPRQFDDAEYQRLLLSDQSLTRLMQHAHDAIVTLNGAGVIVSGNAAAEETFGVSGFKGSAFGLLFENADTVTDAMTSVRTEPFTRRDLQRRHPEGRRTADAIFTAIHSESGEVSGVLVILRDVTVQRRLEAMARDSDQRKDEFLAMLAHELRNPLAPIRTAADLLQKIDADDPRIRNAGQIIARQAGHMNALLVDLLDVSRVTRGRISLDTELLRPEIFISAAVEQIRDAIDTKGQQLILLLDPDTGYVMGDAKRLTQIVVNLLANASRYTHDGGCIHLSVRSSESRVLITVTDNGSGIGADLLPNVFDLFTQADRSLDREKGGLGIGLAIVRGLTTLHGGQVFAQSDGPGSGSTFTVELPRHTIEHQTIPDVGSAAGLPTHVKRVMVVDDNRDAATSLGVLIEMDGHHVAVAHSGHEALERASHGQFDVLILDIGMPGMDGYTLARKLRDLPTTKEALLLAHTGYGQPEDRKRAIDAGFDYHLTKPAEPTTLLQLVANGSTS